jgi:hypothetical protein
MTNAATRIRFKDPDPGVFSQSPILPSSADARLLPAKLIPKNSRKVEVPFELLNLEL